MLNLNQLNSESNGIRIIFKIISPHPDLISKFVFHPIQETFYKFVLCVIVVAVLFVYMMVKVFKVRVREYPFNASDDREWRDWKPANPFHFPWQEVDGQPKKCHVKQE
jgi:hypothetical protein